MKKDITRKAKIVLFFLTSLLLFFLAFVGITEQNIDLNKCDKITSVIIDRGLGYRSGSKGKSQCFYIQLQDHDKKLGVYRMRKNYEDLIRVFHTGDTVTAYFINNGNTGENINIDLVQVQKGAQVLLAKKEYERKESALIYIGAIGGMITMWLCYLYYKNKL